jgi:hypothetical protein
MLTYADVSQAERDRNLAASLASRRQGAGETAGGMLTLLALLVQNSYAKAELREVLTLLALLVQK